MLFSCGTYGKSKIWYFYALCILNEHHNRGIFLHDSSAKPYANCFSEFCMLFHRQNRLIDLIGPFRFQEVEKKLCHYYWKLNKTSLWETHTPVFNGKSISWLHVSGLYHVPHVPGPVPTPCQLQTVKRIWTPTLTPWLASNVIMYKSKALRGPFCLFWCPTWHGSPRTPAKAVAWCPPGMKTGMCMLCVTAVIPSQCRLLLWVHQQYTSVKTNWDNRTLPQVNRYHTVVLWISIVIIA